MTDEHHEMELLQWVADLTADDLTPEGTEYTKMLLEDFLVCAIGGMATPALAASTEVFPPCESGMAHVPSIERPFAVADAARHMATAAHVLEMDDVSSSSSLHPGAVVMAAGLAVGESIGASGNDLLAAVVAGYEVMVRLGEAVDPALHYGRGYHPTATCGALAAACTASKLLGGSVDEIHRAMGFAATGAAGTLSYLNDGSQAKPFQVGNATAYGTAAALLQARGVRGPSTVLAGRYGFFEVHAPHADSQLLVEGLGHDVPRVQLTSVKPFACCRYIQPAIGLILDLLRDHGLTMTDVKGVDVGVLEPAVEIVTRPRERKVNPETVQDAQFSLPFCVAVALQHGRLGPADISGALSQPSVIARARTVTTSVDQRLMAEYPKRWGASAAIQLLDGSEVSGITFVAKGDPEARLTSAESFEKYRALTSERWAERVTQSIANFPSISAKNLMESLEGCG